MPRKPNSLSDVFLIGMIIAAGLLVLLLARSNWGQTVPESVGLSTGQRGPQGATAPLTSTLTLAPRPTNDPAHDPPTRNPAEPTVDDPEMAHPTPSGPIPMPPTPLAEAPFNVSVCAERDTSLHGVVPFSDMIVIGVVSEVQPSRWTTPDGKRPQNPHERGVGQVYPYRIVTPITIAVQQYIRGAFQEREVRVMLSSGKVGNDSVDQCGDTDFEQFEVGQRVVVFLSGRGTIPEDTQAWTLGGRYTINEQNIAFNLQRQMPLDELIKQIEAIPAFPTRTPRS